ncbi:MAG: hypothetical protein IPP15_07720 [Saprospiraceae bacterium]|uniref:DUF5777 domain-containing protein n=1 Tax=Candidatus Opimibacter skivensis TaxID=2982028 RepID=A0A9D7SUM9_9BACT|nr:hypothetical protein [Candidatus Opimibacter skivensis]
MKPSINTFFGAFILLFVFSAPLWAQEADMNTSESKPVKNTFGSIWIIDNQTVAVPFKGNFEFDIQHRFGIVKNGYDDLFGLYAPSNIRLGFGYVPIEKLMIGFGITKTNLTWDVNVKYAILRQMTSGGSPLSVTYFGNAAIDTRDKDYFTNPEVLVTTDRLSFFHQLLFARKFSDKISLQLGASLSHFNTVEAFKNPQNEIIDKYQNDHFAIALSGRYKISPVTNILINYDQPVTTHEVLDPQPNISFGLEITTSSHQFQIFAGNFYNITPQRNNVFNNNRFQDGAFLIGFNMTRLWSL